jgi:two-component system sensor histidine kinase YesM
MRGLPVKHFIQKWLFRHLSTKLIFTLLLLLSFTITVISSIYYWSSSNIIADNVRASTKQSAKQSADYLSLILTVGSDVGQQIFRDARIQQVIQEEARGELTVDQKFDHKSTVDNILNNVMYTSSFVRSIYLLKEEGSSWGSGLFNTSKVARFTLNEQQWYTDVVNNRLDELWLPLQYDPFSGGGENTELVLTFVKPFRNLETRETVGAIVINMDGKLILQAIERIQLGRTGKFFVTSPTGQVLIDSSPELRATSIQNTPLGEKLATIRAEEAEFELESDGNRNYMVTRTMWNNWRIIGTVPVEEVIGDIQQLQKTIWLYASLILALASIIGFLFSRKITSPLNKLMHAMREVEKSNFQALTEVTSQDEVGQLSRRFNQMVRQIEMLIDQVNRVESNKREAEMRALRHQINPHFLYNTLSSIRWMIKFNKTDGAYNGISSLVELMEASMEKKGVFCAIKDELELLKKYMVIQQFRYGSHIELHIDCEPSLMNIHIPRMLLQPIVENAIFHGIAPKEEAGNIHLTVRQEKRADGDRMTIMIKDDGLGIEQEKLVNLLHRSREVKSGMFGIGLNHVHETIQLYYGAQSGVYMESEVGQGTIIRLELMMKAGEDYAV